MPGERWFAVFKDALSLEPFAEFGIGDDIGAATEGNESIPTRECGQPARTRLGSKEEVRLKAGWMRIAGE